MGKAQSDRFLQQVIQRAEEIQRTVNALPQTAFLKKTEDLLKQKRSKFFLIKLLDTSLRPTSSSSSSRHIKKLLNRYPNYRVLFSIAEVFLIGLYKLVGVYFPGLSVPLIKNKIRNTTSSVIFSLDKKGFSKIASKRKKQGVKQNINLIGEALLGEDEAIMRIKEYEGLIKNPEIDYISIKISTIYSQVSSFSYEETLNSLEERLSSLYRLSKSQNKPTFINLDMEEYRDLSLTVDLFIRVLSLSEFKNYYAGLVLQAYIPDSVNYLTQLQEFAHERVQQGGAPIKIRIVKGANLEMEQTEASLKDWPLVTHSEKNLTDAQFKVMLRQTLTSESCQSVRIGVASHNVFDISYAVSLIQEAKINKLVDFEMLEGLSENLIPALKTYKLNLLLYTPVIHEDQFLNAVAYLVRRFDEATADGNFLKESISMQVSDDQWKKLQSAFLSSYEQMDHLKTVPYRTQNRLTDEVSLQEEFHNVPDTDWTRPSNRSWVNDIKKTWEKALPLAGKVIPEYEEKKEREIIRLRNWKGDHPWETEFADEADYLKAIEFSSTSSWLNMTTKERISIIKQAAVEIEKSRGDLIGIGVTEVGKLITEMDPEISEAVDFANFYANSMAEWDRINGLSFQAKGINLVLSPWNFPVAIAAGGVLASLASGNPVILKPARASIACAYLLSQCLWKAGVPKDALHFLPAHSSNLSNLLKKDSPFASVILTGGTDTAQTLLKQNPDLALYAETGGKNATIVTSFADKELAIKHITNSAFGNTGQKCSATSLLILEKEVYDDHNFHKLLADAVQSLKVGSPWELDTQIGPLANPVPQKVKGILSSDQEFLLKGEQLSDYSLSPTIFKGIDTEHITFKSELFGPVLSILQAKDLSEAVEIANQVEYGLTSGLESLNKDEIAYWKEHVDAGNLYINRTTTGAIVKRQPFGGIKASSFGPGLKAGGANYLLQFMNATSVGFKDNQEIADNFKFWNDHYFSQEMDDSYIKGQANVRRFLKPEKVIITISESTSPIHYDLVKLSCETLNISFETVSTETITWLDRESYKILSSWKELIIDLSHKIRYRVLNSPDLSDIFKQEVHKRAINLYKETPINHGRIELLNYLQEQSISHDYHRFGNEMGYHE